MENIHSNLFGGDGYPNYHKLIVNVHSNILTLDISCPCVFPADWRGAGFPSEGANRPYQTPAGAPGEGDRQLRHGEHAAGLRKPRHPGLSQGRLQMRPLLPSSFVVPGLSPPFRSFYLTWPDSAGVHCCWRPYSNTRAQTKTKQKINGSTESAVFWAGQRGMVRWQVLVPLNPPKLLPSPCLSWCHRMTKKNMLDNFL